MLIKQPNDLTNSRLLFIVGATATGKTKLALKLAKQLNADIISADSRQIYQGLEITSGADLPNEFVQSSELVGGYSFFTNNTLNFYGVSFLKPDQEWSIAHFRDFAEAVWQKTKQRQKKLIIVGGSGLYHHSLFLDKNVLHIQPVDSLREELSEKSVEELQTQLVDLYPQAKTYLNESDWQNPRRLIRWIEKTAVKPKLKENPSPSVFGIEMDYHWIGLKCDKEILEKRIKKRVQERIEHGSIQEVERLLALHNGEKLPSFSTLGVKDISLFLSDQITKEELLALWSRHEYQYAKRQMTWFKKREYIQWINLENMFTSQSIDGILS